jgi:hypothetical protein
LIANNQAKTTASTCFFRAGLHFAFTCIYRHSWHHVSRLFPYEKEVP